MKKLLLLSIFCSAAYASAPAPQTAQTKQSELRTISGALRLCRDADLLYFNQYSKDLGDILDKNKKPLQFEPMTIGAIVYVDTDTSKDKTLLDCRDTVPHFLPLSMLSVSEFEIKEEGAPLQYFFKDFKTKEIFHIQAICTGDYGYHFEHKLNHLKTLFYTGIRINKAEGLLAKLMAHQDNEKKLSEEVDTYFKRNQSNQDSDVLCAISFAKIN